MCSLSRQTSHFLQLLAETFAFELERERQLQLRGAATLPPEWAASLERERQEILDELRQRDALEEVNTSKPTPQNQVTDLAPSFIGHAPSAHVQYENHEGSIPHTIQSVSKSITGSGSTSTIAGPSQPEQSVCLPVLLDTESRAHVCPLSHAATPRGGASLSPEAHTSPALSSSDHCHVGATGFDPHRSHTSALGTPSQAVNHANDQYGGSPRTATTRADLRRVERADYKPQAGMFNSAQHTTIHGGTFYFIQGNVSRSVSPA